MPNSIVVNPTVVNDIEFYVSNDGQYSGMSQRGLAKLCGVRLSSLQELLPKVGMTGKGEVESLKVLPSRDSWRQVEATNNADVIPSDVCAAIITYYAFESKAANDTAKYSLAKFAITGIDNWIKQITGFAKDNKEDQILGCLQKLIYDMDELKQKTQAYNNIKGTTVKVFPNLNQMLTDMEVEDELLEVEPDVKEMTAAEWLTIKKGITFSPAQKRRFSLLLSETYKSTVGKEPKKAYRKSKEGKSNNGVFVYHYTEWAILQLCLNKMLYQDNA